MIVRASLLCLFTLLLIGGCAEKESPLFNGRAMSTNDADRLYKARLLELADGKTTRQDVLSVMGDPDRLTEDKRVMMYYWTMKDKEADMISRSFVIVQFGPDDVLQRHLKKNYEAQFGGPKLPDEALAEFLKPGAN